jgi:hypothetical protein
MIPPADRAAHVRAKIARRYGGTLFFVNDEFLDLVEAILREALVEAEVDVRGEYSADQ